MSRRKYTPWQPWEEESLLKWREKYKLTFQQIRRVAKNRLDRSMCLNAVYKKYQDIKSRKLREEALKLRQELEREEKVE